MYFTEFKKSLNKANVVESIRSYRQLIEKTDEGKILVNGEETSYKSLEEARDKIRLDNISQKLEEQVSKELYEELSENTVANIIKECHNIKVTEQLIESYLELASSNIFSVDPVVQKIRSLNKLDKIIEGKTHYVLADGVTVAINKGTQEQLNNLLSNQQEIVEYMRESKSNFFHVLKKIKE